MKEIFPSYFIRFYYKDGTDKGRPSCYNSFHEAIHPLITNYPKYILETRQKIIERIYINSFCVYDYRYTDMVGLKEINNNQYPIIAKDWHDNEFIINSFHYIHGRLNGS